MTQLSQRTNNRHAKLKFEYFCPVSPKQKDEILQLHNFLLSKKLVKSYTANITVKNKEAYIARSNNGEVVGFLIVSDEISISLIETHPSFKGEGIATCLVLEAQKTHNHLVAGIDSYDRLAVEKILSKTGFSNRQSMWIWP